MSDTYGWAGWVVNVERCEHLDDAAGQFAVFNVNLVRPWGVIDINLPLDPATDRVKGPSVNAPETDLGDLLYPWKWTNVTWRVWRRVTGAGGGWQEIPLTPVQVFSGDAPPANGVAQLRNDIEAEIKSRGVNCRYPFSVGMDEFWGLQGAGATTITNRSHAHTMAGLTHWPTAMTGHVLELSRFVKVPKADLANVDVVVAVPQFGFERGVVPAQENAAPGNVFSNYSLFGSPADEFIVAYNLPDIAFVVLSAQAQEPSPAGATSLVLQASQGLLRPHDMRAIVCERLTRTALLASWIKRLVREVESVSSKLASETDAAAKAALSAELQAITALLTNADLVAAMRDETWQSLGIGRELNRHLNKAVATNPAYEAYYANVADLGVPKNEATLVQDLRVVLNHTRYDAVRARAVFNDVLTGIVAVNWPGLLKGAMSVGRTPEEVAGSIERWDYFQRAQTAFDQPTPTDQKDLVEYWRQWFRLVDTLQSEEGFKEAFGPWLSFLHPGQLASAPQEVSDAWARANAVWSASVQPALRTPGMVKTDRVHLVRAALVAESQWNCVSASPNAPGYQVDQPALATASGTAALSLLSAPARNAITTGVPGTTYTFAAHVADEVRNTVTEMHDAGRRDSPKAQDAGLRLDFGAVERGLPNLASLRSWDNRIRGYAIGLSAGVGKGVDAGGVLDWHSKPALAQWITDTAVQIGASPGGTVTWLKDATDNPVWMHETVGATSTAGERALWLEYDEIPAATSCATREGGVKHDEVPASERTWAVDHAFDRHAFGWPTDERPLIKLMPGAYYRAYAAAIDNAGGIFDAALRAPGDLVAQLIPARDIPNLPCASATTIQYLSSERPAQARPITAPPRSMFEMSEETQAFAYQTQAQQVAAGKAHPVALLGWSNATGALLPSVQSSLTYEWQAPSVHRRYFQRWVATDIVIRELAQPITLLSDANFDKVLPASLQTFVNDLTEDTKPMPYHPAVEALGILVECFRGTTRIGWKASGPILVTRTIPVPAAGGHFDIVADPSSVACRVNAAAAAFAVTLAGSTVTVSLPPGHFARIRLYVLIGEPFFDAAKGSLCRVCDGIELSAAELDWPFGFAGFVGYRSFSPSEHWVEAMPRWIPDQLRQQDVELTLAGATLATTPDELSLDIQFNNQFLSGDWVEWVKAIRVTPNLWHWTGYPAKLASADNDWTQWLADYAGTETEGKEPEIVLATSFDPTNQAWRLKPLGASLQRHQLLTSKLAQGQRPARFAVYAARPLLRFHRWFAPEAACQKLAAHVYGIGALIAGRGPANPSQRIATPALRWAIPLTNGYGVDGARAANGAMLIFDEAIRRTDDLALVGGVGDTLEIDLLDTIDPQYREVGANPIFHGKGSTVDLRLDVSEPFGLTFDIGANPKVAQTARVITPVAGAGRWMMARVRARRLILPETEQDSPLLACGIDNTALQQAYVASGGDWPALVALNPALFAVPTRTQGEDAVAVDMAIDLPAIDKNAPPSLSLVLAHGGTAKRLSPFDGAAMAARWREISDVTAQARLLVSWHKARWNLGDPTWRCQVILQRRAAGEMTWTEDLKFGKLSCHDNAASEHAGQLSNLTAWLIVTGAGAGAGTNGPSARQVRMSDYTDPIWVSFVGSFEQVALGHAQDYQFVTSNACSQMQLTTVTPTVGMPVLRSRHVRMPAAYQGDLPTDSQELTSTFHIALVLRPVGDLTGPEQPPGNGALVAVFVAEGKNGEFVQIASRSQAAMETSLAGCHAYIMTVQHPNAYDNVERQLLNRFDTATNNMGWDSFDGLLKLAFREPEENLLQAESLIRFLPEYLGPVPLVPGHL